MVQELKALQDTVARPVTAIRRLSSATTRVSTHTCIHSAGGSRNTGNPALQPLHHCHMDEASLARHGIHLNQHVCNTSRMSHAN